MSLPSASTTGGPAAIDPKLQQELDAPLVALAQMSNGDLKKMLFAFFSFLNRRTDFYMIPHEEDIQAGISKMGFREGDAEKLLLSAFRQFPLRRIPKGMSGGPQAPPPQAPDTNANTSAPAPAPAPSTGSPEEAKQPIASEKDETKSPQLTEEGLQVPVGNGGCTEKYTWTQNIEECTVLIGLPLAIRAKDLDVSIKSNELTAKLKVPLPDESNPRVFIAGTLSESVVSDESTWSVEGGILSVILFKKKKALWDCVIEGDPKIDTTMVDNRRYIDTYDEATQGQIRRIIHEQEKERQGIPVSKDVFTSGKPPNLPPGVEYIDSEKMEKVTKGGK